MLLIRLIGFSIILILTYSEEPQPQPPQQSVPNNTLNSGSDGASDEPLMEAPPAEPPTPPIIDPESYISPSATPDQACGMVYGKCCTKKNKPKCKGADQVCFTYTPQSGGFITGDYCLPCGSNMQLACCGIGKIKCKKEQKPCKPGSDNTGSICLGKSNAFVSE
eukprot:GHVR01050059.1.p1 GENE.GHVR01050059.1~~GHVR01050059.1.p1  ORF type:complete len:164 (-),score=30.12 GHVR01050059.1:22-513(-)